MSWFAEFNPRIDYYNHSVSLDLDTEQLTVITTHAADLFSVTDLCTIAQFDQLLRNPK